MILAVSHETRFMNVTSIEVVSLCEVVCCKPVSGAGEVGASFEVDVDIKASSAEWQIRETRQVSIRTDIRMGPANERGCYVVSSFYGSR